MKEWEQEINMIEWCDAHMVMAVTGEMEEKKWRKGKNYMKLDIPHSKIRIYEDILYIYQNNE